MNHRNTIIGLLTLAFLCTSLQSITSEAVPITESTTNTIGVYNGACGDDLTYSYDPTTHTLTISGTGDMYGFGSVSSQPWTSYQSSITNLVVEEGVTSIGDHAFCGTKISTMSLPESLETIGDVAFSNFPMQEIYIPSKVHDLLLTSFDVNNLSSLVVSEENPYYTTVDGVLYSKDMSTLIFCPSANPATEYTIPEGVTTIGKNAFFSNAYIKSVTIPDSVTTIEEGAFKMSNVQTVTLPSGIGTIPKDAFAYSKLQSITIPDSVTTIEDYAFLNCKQLETVTVPSSVTTIGNKVFSYLGSDENTITIVTPNGSAAWQYAQEYSLTTVDAPQTTTPTPVALLGDANLDDTIDSADLLLIKRYVLGIDDSITPLADYDQDSHVNLLDFLSVKAILLGM